MKRLLLVGLLLPSLFVSCADKNQLKKNATSGCQPKELAFGEYPDHLPGTWRSNSGVIVFNKDGSWSRDSSMASGGSRNWDLNANRLSLNFTGPSGAQSAEFRISNFTGNSFTMSMDDTAEVYTRVK